MYSGLCQGRAALDLAHGFEQNLIAASRLGIARQWLHAVRLGFAHPGDGRPMVFTSAYPADLAASLRQLASES